MSRLWLYLFPLECESHAPADSDIREPYSHGCASIATVRYQRNDCLFLLASMSNTPVAVSAEPAPTPEGVAMRWRDEAVMQSTESPSACLVYSLNITKMEKKTLPAEKIRSLFQQDIRGEHANRTFDRMEAGLAAPGGEIPLRFRHCVTPVFYPTYAVRVQTGSLLPITAYFACDRMVLYGSALTWWTCKPDV